MKTDSFGTAAKMIAFVSLLILLLVLLLGATRADTDGVPPTNEWVNFGGSNSTFLGQPVPAGAVVAAFDPGGTQCGEFTVLYEGMYGVMPCYRDDGTTGEDEGAEPGDVIHFTINNLPATAVPLSLNDTPVAASTTITWTRHGDVWVVDLNVEATPTATPSPTATPTSTATTTPTATATVTSTPTQEGCIAADLTAAFVTAEPTGSINLTARVSNSGVEVSAGLPVAFYTDSALIGTAATTQALGPGASEVVTVTWASETPGDHTITIVANDDGTGTGPVALCGPPAPVQQTISILDVPLVESWNLMSSYVNPFNADVSVVQRPIAGQYVVIQSFDGGALSYYPDLPAEVNTLKEMEAGHGYWVKVKATGELGGTRGNS